MLFLDNDIVQPHINEDLPFDERLHQSYWYVELSDGRKAYSRHYRRSWLELKAWLLQNPSIYIQGLYFGFRDHIKCVHTGKADYFFTNVFSAWQDGPSMYHFVGGWRENDCVKTQTYRLPEIYLQDEGERMLDDLSVQRGLINVKSYLPI